MTLRPLPIAERVIGEYESYLRTEFRARDPKLRADLEAALQEPGFLARDPFFQAHRPFQRGEAWADLGLDPTLAAAVVARTREPLAYLHQSEAIRHLLGPDAGPLGVTTGTGSGKTECFLLPVIQNAIDDAIRFPRRGLTALLVYPMNALANDQQERIEAYLSASGHTHVSVARYDRATRADERAALRKSPPHILLTNYVMLEYLLIRPADRDALWANHRCRFVVLDEVHTYRGALGSNIALLFRRLQAHLSHARQDWRADDRSDRRRFPALVPVATSATIKSVDESGRDPEAVRRLRDAAVQGFLSTLTGARTDAIRVIGESYEDITPPADAIWPASPAVVDPPSPDDEGALRATLAALAEDEPTRPLAELVSRAGILWALADIVSRKPMALDDITDALVERVLARRGADRAAVRREVKAALVAGAALPDDCPGALRLRVHRFIRGGWQFTRCVDPACGRLHPKGEGRCARCHRRTAPLYLCRSCGADTLRFRCADPLAAPLEPGDGGEGDDEWLLYDRDRLEPEDGELGGGRRQMKRRPILGGSFDAASCHFSLDDGAFGLKVMLAPGRNTCMVCGSSAGAHPVLTPVRLGTSAAVRVLAEGLVEGLAEQIRDRTDHDGKERLLIFSDSRQDAAHQARFISYAGRYDRMRRRVLRALADAPAGRLTLEATITRLLALGVEAGDNATLGGGDDDVEFLNQPARERARAWEEAPLLDDLAVTAGFRASIVNLGLVGVRYEALDRFVEKRGAAVAAELGLSTGQLAVLCAALLDELRRRGALSRPLLRYHPANPNTPKAFEAAAWERRIATPRGLVCASNGAPIERLDADTLPAGVDRLNAWRLPKQGGGRPGLEKRFRHLLERMGGIDPTWEHMRAVLELLSGKYLTPAKLHGYRQTHVLLQVDADSVLLERVEPADRRRCSVCNVVMPWVPPGTPCPRCPGTLEPWDPAEIAANRYVRRIGNPRLHALHAAEHTAQVTGEDRIELEADFKAPPPDHAPEAERHSPINVLACSPTLEMGIDVGGLDAVVMRNVPPRPDNYAQRGGRAGRRSRVGLVVGYARNTPHDGYFFDQPAEMIAGEVAAPGVGLGNLDVLKRHLAAVAFGLAEPALAGRMAAYVNIRGEQNTAAIDALVAGLTARLDDAAARAAEAWSSGVLTAAGVDGVAGLRALLDDLPQRVRRVFDRVQHQILTLQETIDRWNEIGRGDYAAINAQRLKRRLLGLEDDRREEADDRTGGHPMRRLAEFGILPGYEFPSEPATLRLWGDSREEEPIRVGRRFGLGQYQPDAIVHARGQRWKVVGLDLSSPFNARAGEGDWLYTRCHGCGLRYDFYAPRCPRCADTRTIGPALSGHAFGGFLALREDRPVLQEEDRFAIAALVQCHPQWDGDLVTRARLPTGWTASVRHGEAIRWVNEWKPPTPADMRLGRPFMHDGGRGFYLCPSCGRTLTVPDEPPAERTKGRRKTRTGRQRDVYGHAGGCDRFGEPPEPLSLVTESKATTLRFRVTLPGELKADDYHRWGHSLGYALRIGLRQLYMLDGSEVEFHLEPMWKDPAGQWFGALTFIDDAVGGSGFLDRAAAELHLVARRALDHLQHDGCDDACYRCLKSYRNQRHHVFLSWPHALPDLEQLATGAPVELPIAPSERDDTSIWLEAYAEGVGSPLELKFLRLFRKHGLEVDCQVPVAPQPGAEPISIADFVIRGTATAIYVDGAAFHRGEALRRDRFIRGRLRENGHWTIAELRAPDLGEGRRLVAALRAGEGRWFESPSPVIDRLTPDDVARRLGRRGCRLYHAINLLDFATYCHEEALLARALLEAGGEPFTPFRSDRQDKDKGLWARTFGNLADFGREFWHGRAPNVYGPITLVFGPGVFAAVDDIAVTRRGAMNADFDLAGERIGTRAELDALFAFPSDHPDAATLVPSCTFAEVSVGDPQIGFEHLERVIVEPVEVAGAALRDRVAELLAAAQVLVPVVGREDEPAFADRAPLYATLVDWAITRAGDAGDPALTLPAAARPWFEALSPGRQGALRSWCRYLWAGTARLLGGDGP